MAKEGMTTEKPLAGSEAAEPGTTVHEMVIRWSDLELARLSELAWKEGATVEEYVRACVLGPRAPGPVELLAEIIQRRLGTLDR
jgi:hypothetical protein